MDYLDNNKESSTFCSEAPGAEGGFLDIPLANALRPLWSAQPHYRKLVGVDWGERRIGLAVSDIRGRIASPLMILERKLKPHPSRHQKRGQSQRAQALLGDLLDIIKKESPMAVCVGLPLNMNGSAGFQAQRVLAFCQELREHLDIPVVLADERLSSLAVERVMIHEDKTRRFRQQHLDKSAAAFVLQGVLDLLNREEDN